ncbi:MAG TPA: N,N-dimethylformamidase beta subunit family domain-containing protein [Thermoleophilaceae bacterium]
MPSSILVRAVFGLLVLSTVGAFFVTQRLKRSTPIVERVFYKPYLSPNGDRRKDTASLRFDLPKRERVTAAMVNDAGDPVRTLLDDRRRSRGTVHMTWDGRDDDGAIVPDGVYHLRVTLPTEGRAVTSPRDLIVDTKPPRPAIVAVTPPTILPGDTAKRGDARIRFRGPSNPKPLFRVYRTDVAGPPRLVRSFSGRRGRQTGVWDGRLQDGRLAPDGIYSISVTVQDKAGNAGSAPATLPPSRSSVTRRSGVSARYLTLMGPLEPVNAGSVVKLTIGPKARRARWNLTRIGPGRPVARGESHGTKVAIRVPGDARTGLYLVRVQAAGHRAIEPLVVRGRGRGPVLVVLPSITWQGLNPVDDDRDGFADTLSDSLSVQAARPFAHGRLPAGLDSTEIPLLRFLDRSKLPYDVTTDLALARGQGPGIDGHGGIIFAGSERWLTEKLDLALRSFVEKGGKVASFGTDAFRRRVDVGPTTLSSPSAPEAVNVFGEQVGETRIEPAPMVVNRDAPAIQLFAHTDGFIGQFQDFEQSRKLVGGAIVQSAAGRDPKQPALVAYKLGDGLVIRMGTPEWATSINGDIEVAQVTRRTWQLLSR